MKKKEDWQPLFFAFIEESYNTPFEWGKWDCCKFSDACIKAITGKALIPKDLKWKDEETVGFYQMGYGSFSVLAYAAFTQNQQLAYKTFEETII